jgi:hypothetical protein
LKPRAVCVVRGRPHDDVRDAVVRVGDNFLSSPPAGKCRDNPCAPPGALARTLPSMSGSAGGGQALAGRRVEPGGRPHWANACPPKGRSGTAGVDVKRTSRIALCMSQLGGKRTVGRRLRPPIRFPPASFESRGDRCACPMPSIRAAPMRRRSFAAASPRPDLQPRRALFRNSFPPRPASSSSRTMHRG